MSANERDEINNPEDHPGVSWRLAPYKNGKRWERVVKPKYGCLHEEQVNQVCTCPKFKPPYVLDLDKLWLPVDVVELVDTVVVFPVLPETGPVEDAYKKALRKQSENTRLELRRMHTVSNLIPDKPVEPPKPSLCERVRKYFADRKANKPVEPGDLPTNEQVLKELEVTQHKATTAFDFIWGNRDLYNYWHHKYPADLVAEKHPIVRLLEDRYPWVYRGEIPYWLKLRVWYDFFDMADLTKPHQVFDAGQYVRLSRMLSNHLHDIMERGRIEKLVRERDDASSKTFQQLVESKMADGLQRAKFENLRLINGEWTIALGDTAVPVILGGRPSHVDLVMEPFYNFNAEGYGMITLERGANHPLKITYDSDYRITKVVRTDTRETLESFSVIEGHVLLDLLIVQVSAMRAINGKSTKTR
jgi:hypothetical protein